MGDTICALSTPVGVGGLAVIRVAGDTSIAVADRIFTPRFGKKNLSQVPSHKAVFGTIHTLDPKPEVLDEALVLVMKGPGTFCGEDTVEIDCHGGMYIVNRILKELIRAGARMAQRGEFSKRAFLNGRMDLSEAEAVMDMISASTSYSLKSAVGQLFGRLSKAIEDIRKRLIDTIVDSEVNIDYPEYDDIPEVSEEKVRTICREEKEKVEELLKTAESGKMLRSGVTCTIVGQPNVGKSSLMNLLLGDERAIVTNVPGTTRDVIEESLDLGGIPVRIIDTAGIRASDDLVEKIGVKRSFAMMKKADLVLMVLDASRPVDPEEVQLLKEIGSKPHLLLLNKTDDSVIDSKDVTKAFASVEDVPPLLIPISVKEKKGIDVLSNRIKDLFFKGDILNSDRPMVTNLRQEEALIRAKEALARVIEARVPLDLLLIDVREAADALSEVSGRSTQDDVVDQIFSRFCLGK